MWPATNGYTLLHSGQPLPGEEEIKRNEGVGIMLNKFATVAWREAGEKWEAVSSRIISARLKISKRRQRRPGGSRESRNVFATIISVYAPTAKATENIKSQFFTRLQDTLDKVPQSDILILLGDFNARVGSLEDTDQNWLGILGRFGIGYRNPAGEDLLQFCARNQLTLMNTWFKKKPHHLSTWMHPATKHWHMIDYFIMPAKQRVLCTDVQVMRGATCWTDHQMIRAKVRMSYPCTKRKRNKTATVPIATHLLNQASFKKTYQAVLSNKLEERIIQTKTCKQTWEQMKSCIIEAAEESLGRSWKKQPDWLLESMDVVMPLIEAKNAARRRLLQSNTQANRRDFRSHQRLVKKAVDAAKETWVCRIAQSAEKDSRRGRVCWKSIKKLQTASHGRRSARSQAVYKESGELTSSPSEVQDRWQQHFANILNVPSEYQEEAISAMPQLPAMVDLDGPPTEEELDIALTKLKRFKAAGATQISPEMLLDGPIELKKQVLNLFQRIWAETAVIEDWKNAEIVPIPKKGDLKVCDNWRGISLLDVVGKVFARIIQSRLQRIAEEILPESQCGFRKGRECMDMIFVARQLVEKSFEHQQSIFILFVDLRKAYDSIPRDALWQVLEKSGVPPNMLNVINSFHDGMKATIRIGSTQSESFSVCNGLRQGCTLAPTLFNLYFNAVMTSWRCQNPQAGVKVKYKHERKLVGDRTTKSKLISTIFTELQFADDAALYSNTRTAFENTTKSFVSEASK